MKRKAPDADAHQGTGLAQHTVRHEPHNDERHAGALDGKHLMLEPERRLNRPAAGRTRRLVIMVDRAMAAIMIMLVAAAKPPMKIRREINVRLHGRCDRPSGRPGPGRSFRFEAFQKG
jgi:hypothetical protein